MTFEEGIARPVCDDDDVNPDQMKTVRKRLIAVVASYTLSLTNFRLELLKRMVEAGHEVVAFAPEDDETVKADLAKIGVRLVTIPMARTGLNPFHDMATLIALWRHFRRLKPDMIVPYTMKPIIYGGIAARAAGIAERCFLVTGLGYVFSEAGTASKRDAIVRRLSIWLYRIAFRGAKVVFVYNDADIADICRSRLLKDEALLTLVPGSGIDLDRYAFSKPPSGAPVFLLMARLLKDKGIVEYVEAARILRKKYPGAECQILGDFDPNPAAISRAEIEAWVAEGTLTYLGATRDVRPYLAQCSVFVLPSYYREGIPRSILEAMSTGRAIITTDLPGCRDTVVAGVNGYLVEARNPKSLAEAMGALAENPGLVEAMGRKSRELAQSRFDVHAVNRILLERMELA